jgi:hypothetical protein
MPLLRYRFIFLMYLTLSSRTRHFVCSCVLICFDLLFPSSALRAQFESLLSKTAFELKTG